MSRSGSLSRISRRQANALLLASISCGLIPGTSAAADTRSRVEVPTRGFNLPGWVDNDEGTAPTGAVLRKPHHLGFRSVRLPVDGNTLATTDKTQTRDTLSRVRGAATTLLTAGYRVIIDLHPSGRFAETLDKDAQTGAQLAETAWARLRDVVADLPQRQVYTELLNEPPLEAPVWQDLRDRLAATVRSRCPHHTIVWGPTRYQGIWELPTTRPLADRNAIAAVHYYFPMGFTHQCENWDSSPLRRISHLPFPATRQTPAYKALTEKLRAAGDKEALNYIGHEFESPWSDAHIAADFADLGRWSRANDYPVILDEFGALRFCSDAASRARWVRAVRSAAEANGAGWIYWELDQGFGFIAGRTETTGFDRSMIEAMMGS